MYFSDIIKFFGMDMFMWPAGAAANAFGKKVSWPLRVAFAVLALLGLPTFFILAVGFVSPDNALGLAEINFLFLLAGYVTGFAIYALLLIWLRGHFFPLFLVVDAIKGVPIEWCEKCQRRARWQCLSDAPTGEKKKVRFFCARHGHKEPQLFGDSWSELF